MSSDNKIIKITVIETGGEFTVGKVSDEETRSEIQKQIKRDYLNLWIYIPKKKYR